jgi:hypothetical protein
MYYFMHNMHELRNMFWVLRVLLPSAVWDNRIK